MRILAGILLFFLVMFSMYAQEVDYNTSTFDPALVIDLPELKTMPVLKSSDLPYFLDNSRLPYFRPIYEQVASECSQVSAIAYNFTYEINRLRDLPADDSANQYPTHFVYNFANRGIGWYGVSYLHSFEILKTLGTPNVVSYGGMAAGGDNRWMNGYEYYLDAMNNRIREAYQISVGTEEGLMQLKQWLHNHLEGSEHGGVASFYANAPWNMRTLYEGTPEAGKKVIVSWDGLPTHAMTITGYNDSIRWDYNWDGQYTNHLDINEDGVVDMKDWEIGGLIFADGWGGGINFGDSGRCYMMYNTLANLVYEGGIWNNVVHVLDVSESYEPELTAKIRLNHNNRNMIRVSIGVSSNSSDTVPQHEIYFPVFNFQGGTQYMQGGTDIEENKTIEFGLDISPLLGLLDSNVFNTFYLIVEERDPDEEGEGFIEYFSVFDHNGEKPIEYISDVSSVPIKQHERTIVSVLVPPALDNMQISTSELPWAVVNEPYSTILTTDGGEDAVEWEMLHAVQEISMHTVIDTTGTKMEPDNWNYGTVDYELNFPFPFYNEIYDSIFIHPAGFIMFEKSTNPWPYLVDSEFFIKENLCIAPLLCRFVEYIPIFGDGIWIKEGTGHVMIRWVTRVDYPQYHPYLEFALELHEDGRIVFIYGEDFYGHRLPWACGISKGDRHNFYFPAISKQDSIADGEAVSIDCFSLPEGMDINSDGVFSGIPTQPYDASILFCAEDHRHVRTYKALNFKASGLGISEAEHKSAILLYPNPTSGAFYLRYTLNETQKLKLELYSLSGVRLRTLMEETRQAGEYNHKIDPGRLSPGVYFLRIRIGNGVETKKLIYNGI